MSPASAIDVALALVWRQGCLLITQRRADTHLGGLWEFPGGKCNPGEPPEQCAVREAMEEVGVACEALGVLPPIEHEYPERTVRLFPVECRYTGGPPRPIQVARWAWVRPVDLEQYSFPTANTSLLEDLRRMAKG